MGVEPTQDGSTAPQTVLKTAPVTGPGAAPRKKVGAGGRSRTRAQTAYLDVSSPWYLKLTFTLAR